MHRYIVIDKGLGISKVVERVKDCGGTNINYAKRARQVFCSLDAAGAHKLEKVQGLIIKKTKLTAVRTHQEAPEANVPVYSALQASVASCMWNFRAAFQPPATGLGLTAVVIDTGVSPDHNGLVDKVIRRENFTDSTTPNDVFDHGTGVAYLIAGGDHGSGLESGVAPSAKIISLKCIGDEGMGSDEWLILAMERARELFEEAVDQGKDYFEDEYVNAVNISAGTEDDGDEDNPVRLALEALHGEVPYRLPVYCSAGNSGDQGPGTIDLPAASEHAWAVGGMTFEPFEVWEKSGRGPTVDGLLTKPDIMHYAVNIQTASCTGPYASIVKAGTSFASPLALGHLLLYREVAHRYDFLDEMRAMSYEQLSEFTRLFCIKPAGAPTVKDNLYGYGMPYGQLLAETVPGMTVYTPGSTTDMVSNIANLMMLGMVGRML